jgi:nucleotidyltransferase substrate binding protein (TIGR01987 family)
MSDSDGPIRLQQLRRAVLRLREALALPDDSVVRDACIQRFEFTFETAWKGIQADALAEGVDCASPRSCLRSAFRIGILERDEPMWLKMVEDRNRTSHVYDEDLAQEIRAALPGYAELFRQLLSTLEDREKLRKREDEEGGSRQ